MILNDRIGELERHNDVFEAKMSRIDSLMDDLGKAGDQDNQAVRNQYAQLRLKFDELREGFKILSGRLEEAEYSLRRQENSDKSVQAKLDRLDKNITLNTNRLIRLDDYLGFEVSEKKNSGIKPKAAADEKLSEVQLYELAKQAFDKGDFENARKGFQKVLKRFPNSQNADNARFWIGETYYREKWYDKAILEYQKVIEEYPKGNKVSAALLKQGIAFYNLGEKTNAGLVLKEVIRRFPQSNEAKIAKQKLKTFKKQ